MAPTGAAGPTLQVCASVVLLARSYGTERSGCGVLVTNVCVVLHKAGLFLQHGMLARATLGLSNSPRIKSGCSPCAEDGSGEKNCLSIKENDSTEQAVIEPATKATQLTTYAEASPGVVQTAKAAPLPRALLNPYMSQELHDLLTRSYLIDSFKWSASGQPVWHPLRFIALPDALLSVPNIAAKLKNFKYLSADVHLEFRMNATPFHVGALQISYLHHTNNTDNAVAKHAYHAIQRSMNRSVVLSASSVNSAAIDIKRHSPQSAVLISDPIVADTAGVWVDVLCPLMTASGTASPADVTISVFANFVDPEVFGYGYVPTSPDFVKTMIKDSLKVNKSKARARDIKHQSDDKIAKEAIAKSKSGVISGVLEAAGKLTPVVAASPFGEFSPAFALAGAAAPFARSLGLAKPTSVQAVQPTLNREMQDHLHVTGLSNAIKFSGHPEAGLGDTDYCECRQHSIAEVIQKPALIHLMTLDPSNPPTVDAPFLQFHPSPSLCGAWDETAANKNHYFPTPCAYMAQMFRSYRGGMKLLFRFITSQYTTARVRISNLPSDDVPSSIEESAGDHVSELVDIRGDTQICIPVPYISTRTYLPNCGLYSVDDERVNLGPPFVAANRDSLIVLSLVNEITNPTADAVAPIYILVYLAAAEDMMFKDFVGFQWNKTGFEERAAMKGLAAPQDRPVRVLKKQSVDLVFAKPFKSLAGAKGSLEAGLVAAEHFSSVEQLCKRFSWVWGGGSGTNPTGKFPNNIVGVQEDLTSRWTSSLADIVGHLSELFLYYRGGMRYRILTNKQSTTYAKRIMTQLITWDAATTELPNQNLQWTDILTVTDESKNTWIEFEIPWMANMPVRMTGIPDYKEDYDPQEIFWTFDYDASTSVAINDLFRAASDDFTFGIQVAPPEWVITYTPPVEGKEKARAEEHSSSPILSESTLSALGKLGLLGKGVKS